MICCGVGTSLRSKVRPIFFSISRSLPFARVDYGSRDAGLAGTTGSARAMGVDGCIVGKAVVDHMGQIVDIEASGCHISGHKKCDHPVAELLHHNVALLLRQIAMQGVGIIAVGDKIVGYLLSVAAGAAENDSVNIGTVVGYAFKREIFVSCIDHIVDMAHIAGTLILLPMTNSTGCFIYFLEMRAISSGMVAEKKSILRS